MQDVTSLVFAYINMLAAPGGVTEKRFEENKALAELRFKFADKSSPYTYAERLSSAMQTYDDRYSDTYLEPVCMLCNLQKYVYQTVRLSPITTGTVIYTVT